MAWIAAVTLVALVAATVAAAHWVDLDDDTAGKLGVAVAYGPLAVLSWSLLRAVVGSGVPAPGAAAWWVLFTPAVLVGAMMLVAVWWPAPRPPTAAGPA